MKKALTLLLLVGCGDINIGESQQDCYTHDPSYFQTVMFCGGRDEKNVEDVFITCNVRKSRVEQFEGCIGDIDLMDLDPDCEIQHVCLENQ